MMPRIRRTSTRLLRLLVVAPAIFAMGMLVACGAPPRDPDTVVMASGTDLESGNPLVTIHALTRQIQRHAMFVTLVRFDSLLQPKPYFARSWEWDAASQVLTMSLASDVLWHDGAHTTANDVQFTFASVKDSSLGSPRAGDFTSLDSAHVVSDTVVQLYFNAAQSRIPNVLAEMPLVPRHLLDTVPRATWRQSAFATAPVGNGPFRFVDRIPGRRWRFARNDNFSKTLGGPPTLAQIVVAVVDEASTKFAGLVSGELDVAGVSPSMAHLVERDPTLRLLTPPALLSQVLAFNTTRAPFDDARVRRAIALSLDRNRVVKAAVAGYATPAGSVIPPGLPMSPEQHLAYDVQQADKLLDEAGWKRTANNVRERNGKPLQVELLTVGSGDMAIEQLVQADLAARGIAVTIRVAEMASFLTTVRALSKTFDFVITGIPGDISLGHLSAMFSTAQRGGALDYTGFHTSSLDDALARARRALPANARSSWLRVDSLLQADAPAVWIYHARGVQGTSRRLEHVQMDLRGELTTIAQWTRRSEP